MKLSDLQGIQPQVAKVEQNTRQFLEGRPANNVLLTGARGTGKSSIVKGLLKGPGAGPRHLELYARRMVKRLHCANSPFASGDMAAVSYTHLRAHET